MTSILSQQKWVFNASNSNAIICKSKNICSVFLSISAICKTFEYFEKKEEPQRWFVSEIIDCKKRGYLNA